MPVSTGDSQYAINNSVSGMICGRIDTYTSDSYVPTALKASTNTTTSSTPTPPSSSSSSSSNGLSGGAIAGIVVGIIAFVAILLGFLFFLLRKRRKSKKPEEIIHEKDGETLHEAETNESKPTVKTVGSLSEAPDTAIAELPPDADVTWAKRQELGAGKDHEVFELPGEEGAVVPPRTSVERDEHHYVSSPETAVSSPESGTRRLSDVTE